MIKVTNGINVIEVSKGAYKDIYERQGYKPFKEVKKSPEKPQKAPESEEKQEDEIIQKPISNWNKEEVINFAKEHDIDISETKNVNEAKSIIKEFIDKM